MVDPSLVKQEPDRADDSKQQDKHRRSDSVDIDAVLREGDRVEANYQHRGRYYPGVVARVRLDGTIDVDYDNGEKESRIAAVDVRSNRARSASTKPRSGEGAQRRRRSSDDVDHLFSDDDDDEEDRPPRRPPSRATSRSRERESSGEEHNIVSRRSRSRSRSVSKGGDGLGGNRRRAGNSSSDSEPLRDGAGRRRRSAGGRRSSSEGLSSTAKKRVGGELGERGSRSRSRNRGRGRGVASSSDEGDEGVRQGSWVEACWHRASPYSRPRRTSNWVSPRFSVDFATAVFPSLSCFTRYPCRSRAETLCMQGWLAL